jgi:hypothetical protein
VLRNDRAALVPGREESRGSGYKEDHLPPLDVSSIATIQISISNIQITSCFSSLLKQH